MSGSGMRDRGPDPLPLSGSEGPGRKLPVGSVPGQDPDDQAGKGDRPPDARPAAPAPASPEVAALPALRARAGSRATSRPVVSGERSAARPVADAGGSLPFLQVVFDGASMVVG